MMAEGIELSSFFTRGLKDSDIEEYHEVENLEHSETAFSNASSVCFLKEYDFFAELDAQVAHKSGKKKKVKQSDKKPSLMEVISSELSSVALPVRRNVILKMDVSADQRNSFLEWPRACRMSQRRPAYSDSEYGYGEKPDPVNLRPVFPKVLKNTEGNSKPFELLYVKPAMFNELVAEYDPEQKQDMKFLDIELNNMQFLHHHKFSLEKLLCVKLSNCYKEYNSIKNSLKDLDKDIKINRETRDSLKKHLMEASPDTKGDIKFDATVRKYTGKIIELKESYRKILQTQKEVIHKIIILWCDIEMVREKTERTESSYNLMIAKETLDQEAFEETWQECFNLEYRDMLDKLEYEYVNRYLEYKEVKHTQNLDDSTKRKISKPKLQIDEEELREDVEEIVNDIIDKEKYQLFLTEEQRKTNADTTSKDSHKTEYFCEIYVDDIFVCQSERFTTKNKHDFSVDFTEIFSVQVLPKNKILSITLNENETVVSSATIDLADVKKSFTAAEYTRKLFVYNEIIEPNAKYVGSGHNIKDIALQNKVRLKSSNLFKGNLYTACEINTKIGWSEKVMQTQSEAIKSSIETGRQIKRLLQGINKPYIGDLIDIITKVYEKDISLDENMVNNLLNICKTEFKEEDTFPIDINSPDIVRLKLLHLRNIGSFSDIDDKLIPLHASQISTEQLNCLQKSDDKENSYLSGKYSNMDPIEVQRFIGSKYVQQLNKNLLKNLNEHLLRKTHKDVVRDFKDLSLRGLFFSPTLSLSSLSSSTRQQLLAEALTKHQSIRVTVIRAYNLPQRQAAVEDDSGEKIAGFRVHPLRPMVRVSYRGHVATTATALGCQPTWSQTLQINTRLDPLSNVYIDILDEYKEYAETEYSSDYQDTSRLKQAVWLGGVTVPLRAAIAQPELRGIFKVTCPPIILGYETPSQAKENAQSLMPDITQIMRKDATFLSLRITTSLSHLGGFESYSQPNEEDDYIIKALNAFVTEFTNDFPSRNISLTFIDSSGKHKSVTQFLQPIPLPDYEYFPKHPKQRLESALSKSSVLSKSSSSKSSDKKGQGDSTYMSGEEKEAMYSTVTWKNEEDHMNKLMDVAARYVALIPTYEVTASHIVTLLGLELLKVVHGSPIDHSLLLWGYFHALGLKVYIAMGFGTRGLSGYVLTAYDHASRRNLMSNDRMRSRGLLTKGDGYTWYVWDATSGDRSEIRDAGCPLKTIHFVFDHENIWVNVQSSLDCEGVALDFIKSSSWRPVFPPSLYIPRLSLAPDPYRPPAEPERLRLALETRLRDKIQRWRTHTKTVWNRYCSSVLRESLPQWEYWALHRAGPKPVAGPRLKQLMASYKVIGFPLNVAYTSSAAVVQAVKRRARAACVGVEVELALAVAVYTYPNNVASVWVYLTTVGRL